MKSRSLLQCGSGGDAASVQHRPIRWFVAATLAGVVQSMYFAVPVQAQEAASDQLQEVVVSAQRREQRLQDVPISVTALGADALQAAGFSNSNAFNGLVPSLVTYAQGPQQIFFLRGIGTSVAAPNGEQSVGVYVDGLYIYASGGNMFPVGAAVDRVEVLKGPQGTLFGRNATAGVIQVFTKDPTQDFNAAVNLGYANYQTSSGDFYVNVPVNNRLAFNVSGQFMYMNDGYGRNVNTVTPPGYTYPPVSDPTFMKKDLTVKSKLLWTPTDSTSIKAMFTYTRQSGSDDFEGHITVGNPRLDGQIQQPLGPWDEDVYWPDRWYAETYAGLLQIDQDVGFAKLENILSYRTIPNGLFRTQNDRTPAAIVNADVWYEPNNALTEEFRVLSPSGSKLNWVAGLYYIKANTGLGPLYISGLAIGPPPAAIAEFDQQNMHAISGYAQGTYEFVKDTNLTLGVRYNHENLHERGLLVAQPDYIRTIVDSQFPVVQAAATLVPPVPNDASYNNTSWRIAIDHKFTPQIMSYISAARSFKSGGFNLAALPGQPLPPFLPEQLTSYELGLKTESVDNRLRFNIAYYHYDYKNIQEQVGIPAGQFTFNGPSAKYNGIDLDFSWLVLRGLTISGGYNYVKGTFGVYPNAIGDTVNGTPITFDGTGHTTPKTPLNSANLNADYVLPTSAGQFALNMNMALRSGMYAAVANRRVNPGYTEFNNSLIWTHPNDRFHVRLWVLNTFNKIHIRTLEESGVGDYEVYSPPRTYGIELGAKF
jgi:iron complex outermembrane receptor protein